MNIQVMQLLLLVVNGGVLKIIIYHERIRMEAVRVVLHDIIQMVREKHQ